MRITGVTTHNIAGLADAHVAFPDADAVAIAGPNGSGKSRLLTCLIAPWLQDLPTAADSEVPAHATVTMMLTELERSELKLLSHEHGWGDTELPAAVEVRVERMPRAGMRVTPSPEIQVLRSAFTNVIFLARVPSLDVVYLPAERRLTSAANVQIDLGVLAPESVLQSAMNVRSQAFSNAGRLDETEFQNYVRALCVAAYLPDEPGVERPRGLDDPVAAWESFKGAADQLLEPKRLLPLTRFRPGQLLIQLVDGSTHEIDALSSGERQALVILGRMFQAGRARTVTIIDEPDLHLHPQLSAQLLASIKLLQPSQTIFATHSPSILDSVPTNAILELRRGAPPVFLQSEGERISAYRAAGFRASELTQSDLLVVTEGESDATLLQAVEPSFARAAFRSAGGRGRVVQVVGELSHFDIPMMGIVDRDVFADAVPAGVVFEWPLADIEATFLADDKTLETMIAAGFVKPEFAVVETLRAELNALARTYRENSIAEVAQRLLRQRFPSPYPTPRGNESLGRLRAAWLADRVRPFGEADFDALTAEATTVVDDAADPFELVRGKWLLATFASRFTVFRDGASLLVATARSLDRPPAGMTAVLNAARSRLNLELIQIE